MPGNTQPPCTEEMIHKDLLDYARDIVTRYGIRIETVEFNWTVHHSVGANTTHAVAQDVTIKSAYSGR